MFPVEDTDVIHTLKENIVTTAQLSYW